MKYSPSQMLLHAYLTEDGVQLSALVDRFYGSRKPQNAHKSVAALLRGLQSRAVQYGDNFRVHTTGRRGRVEALWRVELRR